MPETNHVNHQRILSAIQAELWAITPDALQQVVSIAQGLGDPEAVAAKLGRPLDNSRTVTVRDGVAVIPVRGPIFRYANLFSEISGATSVQVLATDLQAALDNENVDAIVLDIDSPGGQVAGISEFTAQIKAANRVKPVVSYISNIGASAAYWLASGAGEIVASDTAIIGSIGVVMQAASGEDPGTIKFISSQSPYKQADPSTPDGKHQYQTMVDSLANVFIETVAENRGVSIETVLSDFGKGGVMLAESAIAAGMADKLGSLESVISNLKSRKNIMPITREQLAAEAPELLAALVEEGRVAGFAAGKTEGAEAERKRIQEIEALAMPGHDALIAQIKFDGKTTAGEAAVQILAAEKQSRADMADRIKADAQAALPHSTPTMNDDPDGGDEEDEDGDLEQQDEVEAGCKKTWKKDASIRAEFGKFETYLAYERANARGAVRIRGGK